VSGDWGIVMRTTPPALATANATSPYTGEAGRVAVFTVFSRYSVGSAVEISPGISSACAGITSGGMAAARRAAT